MPSRSGKKNLNRDQINTILLAYMSGITNGDQMQTHLAELSPPINISRPTAFKYCGEFKDQQDRSKELDIPVDWGDLDKILKQGVALDHIDDLSLLSTWIEDKFAPFESGRFAPAPTLRNIKWQSYVMSMAPSVTEPLDLWVLGEILSAREMYNDFQKNEEKKRYLGDMSHLIEYLRYKPFENLRNAKRYTNAIKRNAIKSVYHLNEDGSTNRQYEGLALLPEMFGGWDNSVGWETRELNIFPVKWLSLIHI